MTSPKTAQDQMNITWDIGTAFDLFISYAVLKDPKRFGVRSSWASGMRARLQPEDREVLDASLEVFYCPARWIHSLEGSKDAEHCLAALAQMPPRNRLGMLACCPATEDERSPEEQFLVSISEKGMWDESDFETLRELQHSKKKSKHSAPSRKEQETILDTWAQPETFGTRLLGALRSYQNVFFKEEELRIAPQLTSALEQAQERSRTLSPTELIEEISQGIRYDDLPSIEELVLVPSYWISPLVQHHMLGPKQRLWIFGARPIEDSLVPGEPVPDSLRNALKALAEPTRLRILRYLHAEPLTVAELTKRLRLRMPTVIHHLSALRLAGLVSIYFEAGEKGHRQRYGIRTEGLDIALRSLKEFLASDQESSEPEA